jgi:hypothetical protein
VSVLSRKLLNLGVPMAAPAAVKDVLDGLGD